MKRNLLITLVVGILLTAVNQWDVLLREPFSWNLGLKVVGNFLIPFVVSSVSSAVNRNGP